MKFYEFFAGGGMARLGLGEAWTCAFSNDCCVKKAQSYRANFPQSNPLVKSIQDVTVSELPAGIADLAWASFPCQDLSLAGNGAGLDGRRSGTFWAFWDLIQQLRNTHRAPRIIVLENVAGAITSNRGEDFRAILGALTSGGYKFGPLLVDGIHFVPQSRPRLFIIATDGNIAVPDAQLSTYGSTLWHSDALIAAHNALPDHLRAKWMWLNLPEPPLQSTKLSSMLQPDSEVPWHSPEQTKFLMSIMSEVNLRKVRQAQAMGSRVVGTLYKRTRKGSQCAEVRFDEVSGCLRTPGGGSSRQTIVVVEKQSIRSRLVTPRETARLMGVPDTYKLPRNYNEAYHLMGDGLVVPAVAWLERWLLRPISEHQTRELATARLLLRGGFDAPGLTTLPSRESQLEFHRRFR